MKSLRNFLKPGCRIAPIPIGKMLQLLYNSNGVLESVHPMSYEECSGKLGEFQYPILCSDSNWMESLSVPRTIMITGGTTIVYGVAVDESFLIPGKCPYNLITMLPCNQRYRLLCFSIVSYAAQIRGYSAIRNTLKMNDFDILDSTLYPYNDDSGLSNTISSILHRNVNIPEKCKTACKLAVYGTSDVELVDLNIEIQEVRSVKEYMNEYGVVFVNIEFCSGDKLDVPYKVAAKYQIDVGNVLVISHNEEIIASVFGKHTISYESRSCPICGRNMNMNSALLRCSDTHCLSRMYHATVNMLEVLHLPTISWCKYLDSIQNKSAVSIVDFIDILSPNLDIKISFDTLFNAAISPSYVGNRRIISQFVSSCHNKWDTLLYYMENTNKIPIDMDFGKIDCSQLIEFFQIPENVLLIRTLYSHPGICIVETDKFYDAPPIFKNIKICITGDFNNGSFSDIRGILGSYGAEVYKNLEEDVKYLIYGGRMSNINNNLVRQARSVGVVVLSEDEFFNHFDINSDIADNLL